MASAGFMFLTANGVEIHGDSPVTSDERENSIPIVELKHDVTSPVDSSIGGTAGQRVHRVIRITTQVDRSTPLVYKAWSNNEACEVQLKFWRPDIAGTGEELMYFTITLTDARVSSVTMIWPNSLRPDTAAIPEQVEIGFTYGEITWSFEGRGIEHTDQWYERL